MSAQKSNKSKKAAKDNVDTLSFFLDKLRNTDTNIKKDFLALAIGHLPEIVQAISHSDGLSLEERVNYLKDIRMLATLGIETIVPKIPDVAPALWKERGKENYHMSPCDFVLLHYPSLGFGLSQSDLGRLDPPLLEALKNWKRKYGWPDGFTVPTQKQINDELLRELGFAESQSAIRLRNIKRNRRPS